MRLAEMTNGSAFHPIDVALVSNPEDRLAGGEAHTQAGAFVMFSAKIDVPVVCHARTRLKVQLVVASVPAGFPSPADDDLDNPLDFNELLIAHPAATFAVRVAGDSMIGAGIFPGDIAIVDRALKAADGNIILSAKDRKAGMTLSAAYPAGKMVAEVATSANG